MRTTSLFDRGKTNACVQRCDDTTLVRFSSPLEVTTEDFDAQTVALNLSITVMRPITPNCDDEFTVILVRTSNNWFHFLFLLFSCWRREAGEVQQGVEEGLDVSQFSYVTAS